MGRESDEPDTGGRVGVTAGSGYAGDGSDGRRDGRGSEPLGATVLGGDLARRGEGETGDGQLERGRAAPEWGLQGTSATFCTGRSRVLRLILVVVGQIRNQALNMQQLPDGSVAWNSSSVEVEYVSVSRPAFAPDPLT